MRIAVISDVHANLAALEAVIADWGAVDGVWHLGDTVGYGPDPVACIERLQELGAINLAGNHDWAVIDRLDLEFFNPAAAEVVRWTASQLTDSTRSYLASLPTVRVIDGYTLVHGSPRDPIGEYLLDEIAAAENFAYLGTPVGFIGHSHVPVAFTTDSPPGVTARGVRREPVSYREIQLGQRRHLINPGSVGQPRDGDPAARYLILDTQRRIYQRRRIEYPIADTQQRMRAAGLPASLWVRLAYGR